MQEQERRKIAAAVESKCTKLEMLRLRVAINCADDMVSETKL